MKKIPFKKLLAALLASLLPTQTVLASMAESNFWSERRQSTKKVSDTSVYPQYASLPSTHPSTLPVLNQLPKTSSVLPQSSKWSDIHKNDAKKISKPLENLLNAVPLTQATVSEIYDAGKNSTPLLLVQDIHLNPEAQMNIAGIIQNLINKNQVGLVGIEAAFDPFDFSPLRGLPDQKKTHDVVRDMVGENKLAAASYVGITSSVSPPLYVGIDDLDHYRENVRAYLSTRKIFKKVTRWIEEEKKNLALKKSEVFSPALKKFDDLKIAQHEGRIGFGDYLKALAALGEYDHQNLDPGPTTLPGRRNGNQAMATNNAIIPATNISVIPATNATVIPATNATVIPATNATVIPATNATVIPATNATVIPATNATVIPATNATVIPAMSLGRDPGVAFAIEQFLAAFEMESIINFAKADIERKRILEKLTRQLNESELKDLLSRSLAYRAGELSFGAYYQHLKNLCQQNGINLKQTPHFDNYIRYVLLSDGINATELFSAVKNWEKDLLSQLATTEEEKELAEQSDLLLLTEKLVNFTLTPSEWETYQTSSRNFPKSSSRHVSSRDPVANSQNLDSGLRHSGMTEMSSSRKFSIRDLFRNKNQTSRSSIKTFEDDGVGAFEDDGVRAFKDDGLGTFEDHELKPFEEFYRQADIRSEKMINKFFLDQISKIENRPSLIIVGGFHTEHMSQLLKDKKISYAIVSPKVTKIENDKGSEYLSLFEREKSTLDLLFKGEKLSLAHYQMMGVGGTDLTGRLAKPSVNEIYKRSGQLQSVDNTNKNLSPEGKAFSISEHFFSFLISILISGAFLIPTNVLLPQPFFTSVLPWVSLVIFLLWSVPIGLITLLAWGTRVMGEKFLSKKSTVDKKIKTKFGVLAAFQKGYLQIDEGPVSHDIVAKIYFEPSPGLWVAKWFVQQSHHPIFQFLRKLLLPLVLAHEQMRIKKKSTFVIFLSKPLHLLSLLKPTPTITILLLTALITFFVLPPLFHRFADSTKENRRSAPYTAAGVLTVDHLNNMATNIMTNLNKNWIPEPAAEELRQIAERTVHNEDWVLKSATGIDTNLYALAEQPPSTKITVFTNNVAVADFREIEPFIFHEFVHLMDLQRKRGEYAAQLIKTIIQQARTEGNILLSPEHRENFKRYIAIQIQNEVEAYALQALYAGHHARRLGFSSLDDYYSTMAEYSPEMASRYKRILGLGRGNVAMERYLSFATAYAFLERDTRILAKIAQFEGTDPKNVEEAKAWIIKTMSDPNYYNPPGYRGENGQPVPDIITPAIKKIQELEGYAPKIIDRSLRIQSPNSPLSLLRHILLRQAINRGEDPQEFLSKPWVKWATVGGAALEAIAFGSLGYFTALPVDSIFGLLLAAVRIVLVAGFFTLDYKIAPPINGTRGSPKWHIGFAAAYSMLPFLAFIPHASYLMPQTAILIAAVAFVGIAHIARDAGVALGVKGGTLRTGTDYGDVYHNLRAYLDDNLPKRSDKRKIIDQLIAGLWIGESPDYPISTDAAERIMKASLDVVIRLNLKPSDFSEIHLLRQFSYTAGGLSIRAKSNGTVDWTLENIDYALRLIATKDQLPLLENVDRLLTHKPRTVRDQIRNELTQEPIVESKFPTPLFDQVQFGFRPRNSEFQLAVHLAPKPKEANYIFIAYPNWRLPNRRPFEGNLVFSRKGNELIIHSIQVSHTRENVKSFTQRFDIPNNWDHHLMRHLIDWAEKNGIKTVTMSVPATQYVRWRTIPGYTLFKTYVSLPYAFNFKLAVEDRRFQSPQDLILLYSQHMVWKRTIQSQEGNVSKQGRRQVSTSNKTSLLKEKNVPRRDLTPVLAFFTRFVRPLSFAFLLLGLPFHPAIVGTTDAQPLTQEETETFLASDTTRVPTPIERAEIEQIKILFEEIVFELETRNDPGAYLAREFLTTLNTQFYISEQNVFIPVFPVHGTLKKNISTYTMSGGAVNLKLFRHFYERRENPMYRSIIASFLIAAGAETDLYKKNPELMVETMDLADIAGNQYLNVSNTTAREFVFSYLARAIFPGEHGLKKSLEFLAGENITSSHIHDEIVENLQNTGLAQMLVGIKTVLDLNSIADPTERSYRVRAFIFWGTVVPADPMAPINLARANNPDIKINSRQKLLPPDVPPGYFSLIDDLKYMSSLYFETVLANLAANQIPIYEAVDHSPPGKTPQENNNWMIYAVLLAGGVGGATLFGWKKMKKKAERQKNSKKKSKRPVRKTIPRAPKITPKPAPPSQALITSESIESLESLRDPLPTLLDPIDSPATQPKKKIPKRKPLPEPVAALVPETPVPVLSIPLPPQMERHKNLYGERIENGSASETYSIEDVEADILEKNSAWSGYTVQVSPKFLGDVETYWNLVSSLKNTILPQIQRALNEDEKVRLQKGNTKDGPNFSNFSMSARQGLYDHQSGKYRTYFTYSSVNKTIRFLRFLPKAEVISGVGIHPQMDVQEIVKLEQQIQDPADIAPDSSRLKTFIVEIFLPSVSRNKKSSEGEETLRFIAQDLLNGNPNSIKEQINYSLFFGLDQESIDSDQLFDLLSNVAKVKINIVDDILLAPLLRRLLYLSAFVAVKQLSIRSLIENSSITNGDRDKLEKFLNWWIKELDKNEKRYIQFFVGELDEKRFKEIGLYLSVLESISPLLSVYVKQAFLEWGRDENPKARREAYSRIMRSAQDHHLTALQTDFPKGGFSLQEITNLLKDPDSRSSGNGGQSDIGIASDHLGLVSREDHEAFHEEGEFEFVLRDLAADFNLRKGPKGFYDFRTLVPERGDRIKTDYGEIRQEKDGLLVIVDTRFKHDHAGRGQYAAYARNSEIAGHEIVELRGWAAWAVSDHSKELTGTGRPLLTWNEISQGKLGTRLRDLLNGKGRYRTTEEQLSFRREKMEYLADLFHRRGLLAEGKYMSLEQIIQRINDWHKEIPEYSNPFRPFAVESLNDPSEKRRLESFFLKAFTNDLYSSAIEPILRSYILHFDLYTEQKLLRHIEARLSSVQEGVQIDNLKKIRVGRLGSMREISPQQLRVAAGNNEGLANFLKVLESPMPVALLKYLADYSTIAKQKFSLLQALNEDRNNDGKTARDFDFPKIYWTEYTVEFLETALRMGEKLFSNNKKSSGQNDYDFIISSGENDRHEVLMKQILEVQDYLIYLDQIFLQAMTGESTEKKYLPGLNLPHAIAILSDLFFLVNNDPNLSKEEKMKLMNEYDQTLKMSVVLETKLFAAIFIGKSSGKILVKAELSNYQIKVIEDILGHLLEIRLKSPTPFGPGAAQQDKAAELTRWKKGPRAYAGHGGPRIIGLIKSKRAINLFRDAKELVRVELTGLYTFDSEETVQRVDKKMSYSYLNLKISGIAYVDEDGRLQTSRDETHVIDIEYIDSSKSEFEFKNGKGKLIFVPVGSMVVTKYSPALNAVLRYVLIPNQAIEFVPLGEDLRSLGDLILDHLKYDHSSKFDAFLDLKERFWFTLDGQPLAVIKTEEGEFKNPIYLIGRFKNSVWRFYGPKGEDVKLSPPGLILGQSGKGGIDNGVAPIIEEFFFAYSALAWGPLGFIVARFAVFPLLHVLWGNNGPPTSWAELGHRMTSPNFIIQNTFVPLLISVFVTAFIPVFGISIFDFESGDQHYFWAIASLIHIGVNKTLSDISASKTEARMNQILASVQKGDLAGAVIAADPAAGPLGLRRFSRMKRDRGESLRSPAESDDSWSLAYVLGSLLYKTDLDPKQKITFGIFDRNQPDPKRLTVALAKAAVEGSPINLIVPENHEETYRRIIAELNRRFPAVPINLQMFSYEEDFYRKLISPEGAADVDLIARRFNLNFAQSLLIYSGFHLKKDFGYAIPLDHFLPALRELQKNELILRALRATQIAA